MNNEMENREDSVNLSASEDVSSTKSTAASSTFKVRDPGDRPTRKEKSPLRKFLPPVLGGLAALPLATAILWYGFGKDIGGIGPAVAQYAPWIVPKKLRGNGFRADGTLNTSNTPNQPNPQTSSRAQAPEGFKSSLPSLGQKPPVSNNTNSNRSSLPDTQSSTPIAGENSKPIDPKGSLNPTQIDPNENSKDSASPKSDEKDTSNSVDAPTQTPTQTPSQSQPTPGTQPHSRSTSRVDLSTVIEQLIDLKNQWSSIPREKTAQLNAVSQFYSGLCQIAELSDSNATEVIEAWKQSSHEISDMILGDAKFSALVTRCASGEIPDIVKSGPNDYVVTVAPTGLEFLDGDASNESNPITSETVIAGKTIPIEFPSTNQSLMQKAKDLKSGSPVVLFLRMENQDGVIKAIATDCLGPSSEANN